MLIFWILIAVAGFFIPQEYSNAIDLNNILSSPNLNFIFGTDELGRSVLLRLIVGASNSFLTALSVVGICSIFGCFIGVFSAYLGGFFDKLFVSITNIFLSFPNLLLSLTIAAILGAGMINIIIALSITGWVSYARIARAQALSIKTSYHVLAAQSFNQRKTIIIFKHLLPLCLAPIFVEVNFGLAGVIIAEASLSFLGIGIQPPDASWGLLIKQGTNYFLYASHLIIIPCILISLVIISINYMGNLIQTSMNNKHKLNNYI